MQAPQSHKSKENSDFDAGTCRLPIKKGKKKCCMSDSNRFALISQLRGWKGDTSLCLQSYKIKSFKMAAFIISQYYPPLALCKNIYILW